MVIQVFMAVYDCGLSTAALTPATGSSHDKTFDRYWFLLMFL